MGIALLDVARELGVGVSTFISLGNKADVSGNDLLAAWLDDPAVTGAALYLESFGNAPKFARIARRFAERKPLLAVVGGRSASGQRGGASHTAAAATPAVGIDALFSQAGVIACTSAEEMGRTALLLAEQPLPAGRRIAIVSNAGGLGVLAADAADVQGLEVPELSTDLRAELGGQVSGTTGTSNPIDLGAGASADNLAGVVEPLLASAEVDALLVVLVPTSVAPAQPLVDALVAARDAVPRQARGPRGPGRHRPRAPSASPSSAPSTTPSRRWAMPRGTPSGGPRRGPLPSRTTRSGRMRHGPLPAPSSTTSEPGADGWTPETCRGCCTRTGSRPWAGSRTTRSTPRGWRPRSASRSSSRSPTATSCTRPIAASCGSA